MTLRLATYNVEWFTALFDDADELIEDDAPGGRHEVSRGAQAAALGIVLTAIDADAVMIIEAPNEGRRRSTVRALENFARICGLRTRRALIGFPSETDQEIALLYDPDVVTARHDPRGAITGKKGSVDAPRFDGVFRFDPGGEGGAETISFSRPPLELAVETAAGLSFRMIGVHAKSKAPHGARSEAEALRLSIANRRKQLAQCIWLRQRVEHHLAAGESLIVLGDLNDGPGIDGFEKLFGVSGVEIVLGHDAPAHLQLHDPHAALALRQHIGVVPTTARFFVLPEARYFPALLDYIMVSPDLAALCPRWRIWHPFDDPVCWRTPELREALLAASDHFPVTLDLPPDPPPNPGPNPGPPEDCAG